MQFKKGESGNPKGRPPKQRALTEILERAGAASVDINGKKVSGKKLLASMLWEAATTGRVTFPNDSTLACDFDQWLGVAKFIYTQTDGPPKQAVELDGPNGGPIPLRVFSHESVIARIAPRPAEDIEASGADEDG